MRNWAITLIGYLMEVLILLLSMMFLYRLIRMVVDML
nr:MAG TPA: hypothetical protein [Caudoviricetes sp.]